MKTLHLPEDNKKEQIFKIKENFIKKINNKLQYNTMNNSVYNNRISRKKIFFPDIEVLNPY